MWYAMEGLIELGETSHFRLVDYWVEWHRYRIFPKSFTRTLLNFVCSTCFTVCKPIEVKIAKVYCNWKTKGTRRGLIQLGSPSGFESWWFIVKLSLNFNPIFYKNFVENVSIDLFLLVFFKKELTWIHWGIFP